jgi:hypothetical protein
VQRNATEIAGAGRVDGYSVGGLARSLMEQLGIARGGEASVPVLQAEDRLLGALLDVQA